MVLSGERLTSRVTQFQEHRGIRIEKHGLMSSSDRISGFRESSEFDELDLEAQRGWREPIVVFPLDRSLVEICGIDLRVGEVYIAKSIFEIDNYGDLKSKVAAGKLTKLNPSRDGELVLEADENGRNVHYIFSYETINVPDDLVLQVDAKSTTGRVACMATRRNYHFSKRFSHIESRLLVTAQPYNFDLIVRKAKTSLVSASLRGYGDRYMTKEEVIVDKDNVQLFLGEGRVDLNGRGRYAKDGFMMSFSSKGVVRAKRKNEVPGPIDMDAKGVYNPWKYFDLIEGNGKEILFEEGRFYLTGTLEEIRLGNICAFLSRETHETGTGLWGHFAGTIQPGFVGEITMECRSNVERTKREGDPAAFFQCDKLMESYPIGSHTGSYQNQRAPLFPKMFKKG